MEQDGNWSKVRKSEADSITGLRWNGSKFGLTAGWTGRWGTRTCQSWGIQEGVVIAIA